GKRDQRLLSLGFPRLGSLGLGYMSCDCVHQWRTQAIIGLKAELPQARPDSIHLLRLDAGLDHGRHERRKARRRPAALLEQFRMDEIETVERMALVLDTPVHMRTADLAGMTLDHRRRVDDLKLVAVFEHGYVLTRYNGDDRKSCALGLPAFGAPTSVVVRDVALDGHLDGAVLALANQGAAGKVACTLLHAVVDPWVNLSVHGLSSLCLTSVLVDDDRADRLACMHQVKTLVDILELEDVSNHRINLNPSVHVPVDDFWDVGSAACAAERSTLPDAASDQLERPGCDFLAGLRDADDYGNSPSAMAALKGLAHDGGVACAVEAEIGAAVGQRDQVLDQIAADL